MPFDLEVLVPRVFSQTAGKDYPEHGIKKGETYYSWSFYRQAKRISKTYPRPSQLTQSHWADIYAAREAIEDTDPLDLVALKAVLEEAASIIEDVQGRYEEAAEAMGSAGERNQTLADQCTELADALTSLVNDLPDEDQKDEDQEDEDQEDGDLDRGQEVKDEALSLDWEPQE